MKLNVKDLTYEYQKGNGIESIDLDVQPGSFVGIIGPNGSGKSTFLKNIYRALKPDHGCILCNDQELLKMSYKESSQFMAVVGQENEIAFDFEVDEVVKMGRTPHKKIFELDNTQDEEFVHKALKQVGLENDAKRNYSELSGGEKQRVLLARALCQNAEFLILDEPTNHLDIYYQLQLFELVNELDVTVLSAVHDLNIASLYCDYLYVFKDGKIYKHGKPEDILTSKVIEEVFHVNAEVIIHPITKKPHITYLPLTREKRK